MRSMQLYFLVFSLEIKKCVYAFLKISSVKGSSVIIEVKTMKLFGLLITEVCVSAFLKISPLSG